MGQHSEYCFHERGKSTKIKIKPDAKGIKQLEDLVEDICKQSEYLVHKFSSQRNESFNSIIIKYASKRQDWKWSYSLRVMFAFLHYNNKGQTWKLNLLKEIGWFEENEIQESKITKDTLKRKRKNEKKILENEKKKRSKSKIEKKIKGKGRDVQKQYTYKEKDKNNDSKEEKEKKKRKRDFCSCKKDCNGSKRCGCSSNCGKKCKCSCLKKE